MSDIPRFCRCDGCGAGSIELVNTPHTIVVDPNNVGNTAENYCGMWKEVSK